MKFDDFEKLSPIERREFLKFLGGFLALPLIPSSTKAALIEVVLGPQAAAQSVAPAINFLEINFRDQWDFGHLFVPPSIAKNYANVKSGIALFDNPIAERNNFYVTPQAEELRPHLDSIAVMELGECVLPGNTSVHGHEAGNPLRSPGRSQTQSGNKRDMATVDLRPGGRVAGNEILYSTTPTPAVLHNYYSKSVSPNLKNGVNLRSTVRSSIHTFYHFEGNLNNAQVDRFFDQNTFLSNFKTADGTAAPSTTLVQKNGAILAKLLKRVDEAYMKRVLSDPIRQSQHSSKLTSLETKLGGIAAPQPFAGVTLTAAEKSYWTSGITAQLSCPGDNSSTCEIAPQSWHVGELFGYASKLFQSQQVRSVAIDFDVSDVHTNRTPFLMRTMAQQSGMTLARLIQDLKNKGLYDKTLIAMYTLDGSRSPQLSSTGDGTKNSIILAGGMVKGGYYGDLNVEADGSITYFRPDDNGNPIPGGTKGRDLRVPAADIYRTIAKLAGIPDALLNTLPDVAAGKFLTYVAK
ncbi:MAG: DUF1501 domain-containing protein [Bdellovibrionota bacterium]